MDIDPNDLLSTNVYIQKSELNPDVSLDNNEEFRKYYEKEIQKKSESKIIASINKIELDENDDDNNIINTNNFNKESESGNQSISRFIRESKTLVSIDSRDRIKTLYPKPNNFKIFLGRTFSNVKKIEMVSLEFPNTDAVINSGNNRIYWRNLEDIENDVTVTTNGIVGYPIYSVELRTGSYTSATLQNEIQTKLNEVRRRQGTTSTLSGVSSYHYFVANLDIDTDIVTLTSLNLKQLSNSPLSTQLSSNRISVYFPGHGFALNDFIYIVGAKSIAGISSTVLNGFQKITSVGPDNFQFEVNVQASDTIEAGGGNVVKAGTKLPYQLLWGENSLTVAQNIGFPLENSSQLIVTNINKFLENIVQMDIELQYGHGFEYTYDYIGQVISLGDMTSGIFTDNFYITNIYSNTGIRVQVSNESQIAELNVDSLKKFIKFGNKIIPVISYSKYVVQSFLVTTVTEHNYTLKDINTMITLSNTTDPTINDEINYDGTYLIQSVPSPTTFILPGTIGTQKTHLTNIYGTLSRKTPLTTWIVKIIDVTLNCEYQTKIYTKITTSENHKMLVGDKVMINNLKSMPLLTTELTIIGIPTSNSFLIDVQINNIDLQNSIDPYVGTGLITVSFPSHGFNTIINISNGAKIDVLDENGVPVAIQPIVITTLNSHNLKVNDMIRISGTDPVYIDVGSSNILIKGVEPSLDGGGYIVKSIDSEDTFTIVKSNTTITFNTLEIGDVIKGILGLNDGFYLYDVEDIGGISKTMLNNILFSVRDIIDDNTFTFIAQNVYATKTEIGGGSNIYINSLKHGFNGIQTNTKNGLLTRSINLQGEDYCFITCPQLDTMLNTGGVNNIFSRISLDQPPGYVCFKYLSNPKHFNTMPLDKLSELEFSIVNYNSSLYDFNDLDYSFTLQITEVSDATKAFNVSSKRGVTDTS
jgi:hypothetical protein